jgi:cytoskeletal protein RodZ
MPPFRIVPVSSRDEALSSASGSPLPVDVVDVGAALREARQRLGFSLDDLERRTKIRPRVLRAIETNHRDQLPEPVFARGFVRAYAREVGLDPVDTVRRYFAQFAPVPAAAEPSPAPVAEPAAPSTRAPVDEALARDERWRVGSQWAVIGLVLAVSVIVYTMGQRWTSSAPSAAAPISDGATDSSRAASSDTTPKRPETGTAGSREPTAPPADHTLHIDILVQGPCWVAATVDGTRVVTQLMQAGERSALTVRENAVLRVGEPGAFAYSINGVPGRPLGPAGQPVTVRITAGNYLDFLGQ